MQTQPRITNKIRERGENPTLQHLVIWARFFQVGIFKLVTFKHGPTLFPHCHFPSFDGRLIIKHLIIGTNAFHKNIKARISINQKPNFPFRRIIRYLGKCERA